MKPGTQSLIAAAAILLWGMAPARAILIIEWGTPIFSELYDSYGNELDDSYTWELGAFDPSFTPTSSNVELWAANWLVFDQAAYNAGIGYVAGNVIMNNDGTSTSSYADPSGYDFQGLDAYIWGYNNKTYQYGLEWVIFRAEDWTFPVIPPDDPPTLEVEWSISDLIESDVPLWGSQLGVIGLGYASNPGIYDLQTYTIVPEPTGIAVGVLLLGAAGFHRWRKSRRIAG